MKKVIAILYCAIGMMGTTLGLRPMVAAAATAPTCVVHAYGGPLSEAVGPTQPAPMHDIEWIAADAECTSINGVPFAMSVGVWVETQLPDGTWTSTSCTSGPFVPGLVEGTTTTGTYGTAVVYHVCDEGPYPEYPAPVLHRAHAQVWESVTPSFTDTVSLVEWPMV